MSTALKPLRHCEFSTDFVPLGQRAASPRETKRSPRPDRVSRGMLRPKRLGVSLTSGGLEASRRIGRGPPSPKGRLRAPAINKVPLGPLRSGNGALASAVFVSGAASRPKSGVGRPLLAQVDRPRKPPRKRRGFIARPDRPQPNRPLGGPNGPPGNRRSATTLQGVVDQ